MRLIAHRGFAATNPENTIWALQAAAAHPAVDAVEFDVRRCGSGELVVFHDPTLERVTDGQGTLAETPLADLETLEVLDSGEPIPTLEAVLEALPLEVEVNLEMKALGIGADVVETLEAANLENRVVTTSFLTPELRRVREADPEQPTGLLVSRRLAHPVTRAVELDCDVIGANHWRCLTTGLVPRAQSLDLEIHAWTVEKRSLAWLLGVRGVDYVSADRPLKI